MFMRSFLLVLFTSLLWATPAKAEIDVTFYNHDFGKSFPHAFFTLKGTLENGEEIDTSYGFTATKVSPAILWKSVTGAVQAPSQKYIDKSNPHFTVTASDDEYNALLEIVTKWENIEQKSYSLKKRNCVHFVSEAIAALGYKFNEDTEYWRKPKKFFVEVLELNPELVAIDYEQVKEDIKAAKKLEKETVNEEGLSENAANDEILSSEAPSSEAPSSEAPSSEAPSSEAPSSEAPSSESPSADITPEDIQANDVEIRDSADENINLEDMNDAENSNPDN